jgi:hypothetical protein
VTVRHERHPFRTGGDVAELNEGLLVVGSEYRFGQAIPSCVAIAD